MKKKTFKSRTNDGQIVKVEVIFIESTKPEYEDAIIIQTKRLVPVSDIESYIRINDLIPTYFLLRKTDNYALIVSRTQSFKRSTLSTIIDFIK